MWMKKWSWAGAVALLAMGCGGTELPDEREQETAGDVLGEQDDGLSQFSPSFVRLRWDVRKCAPPACGGAYVQDANVANAVERYVDRLDFSQSGLDSADQNKVRLAPAEELVLLGKLSSRKPDGYRSFVVLEAYRGLPGVKVPAGAKFYAAEFNGVACIQAPCPSFDAELLNSNTTTEFTDLDVLPNPIPPQLDGQWLSHRVLNGRGLVAGNIVDGQTLPGGTERILDAEQVFLRVPEVAGPCPAQPEPLCMQGTIQTYARTGDRCIEFAGCKPWGVCPAYFPMCATGYKLVTWQGGDFSACPQYACDPDWVE